MNLIDGMQREMNRCRELLKLYEQIPTGTFGAAVIKQGISKAEKAIADDSIVEMLKSYEALKGFE